MPKKTTKPSKKKTKPAAKTAAAKKAQEPRKTAAKSSKTAATKKTAVAKKLKAKAKAAPRPKRLAREVAPETMLAEVTPVAVPDQVEEQWPYCPDYVPQGGKRDFAALVGYINDAIDVEDLRERMLIRVQLGNYREDVIVAAKRKAQAMRWDLDAIEVAQPASGRVTFEEADLAQPEADDASLEQPATDDTSLEQPAALATAPEQSASEPAQSEPEQSEPEQSASEPEQLETPAREHVPADVPEYAATQEEAHALEAEGAP